MKTEIVQDREELKIALIDAGAAWARYGLGVGRAALEASATTLASTARLLERVADRVDEDAEALRNGDEIAHFSK